jgi:hypothetical protein
MGMRILLGLFAIRSREYKVDEAAVFNQIREGALHAPLRCSDGAHFYRVLCLISRQRTLDLVKKMRREVLAEDIGQPEEVFEAMTMRTACERFARMEEGLMIRELVAEADHPTGKVLNDAVWQRYLEVNGQITQVELAKEFQIPQCRVSRILAKGKEVLRRMHEADLGRLQPKPERKKRVASRRMDKPSEEPTVDME